MVGRENLRKGNDVTEDCRLIKLVVIEQKTVKEILTLMQVSVRMRIH